MPRAGIIAGASPNRRFIDSDLYLPSMHSQGIDAIAIIIDTSASLPGETLALFWAEVREIAAELQPNSIYVLQVDAVLQDAAQYPAGELPDSITIQGTRRDRFPARLRMAP